MTKVKIQVINQATEEDITESTEISVYNQNTGRTISERTDGYYHCNAETLYTITAIPGDGTHTYSYDLYFLTDRTEPVEKVFEVIA